MKKIKLLFCILLLSTVLVNNVSAYGFTTAGTLSYLDSIINAIVEIARSPEECPFRICSNCKPGTTDDGNGNCKPTQN